MWKIMEELLEERHVKVSQVAKATGVNLSTFTDWKTGRCHPKIEKMQKIADYFGVSVEYITTGKDKQFSDESAELAAKIRRVPELQDALSTLIKLPEEDRQLIYTLIKKLNR